jgi:hypothetical protein
MHFAANRSTVRLKRIVGSAAMAGLLVASALIGIAMTASAATPTSLALPQSAAFSLLGHSCGGIQETVYASGFDPGTGYPSGAVYMSTRCGGSGRGGGGSSTLYSAWANVTWDFTTAVVSYARAPTTPTVNPTLAVYDSHGNELYNQAVAGVVNGTQVYSQAFLVLAAGFVPAPRVTGISTTRGPTSGGTSVTITGTGFTGATAASFGSTAANSFTVGTSTSITAVAPAAPAGTVDVTVTNAGGTSATSAADQFTFIAPPTVTAVSPNSSPLAGGNWVTVTGTDLGTTNRLSIGDNTTAFNVLSNTSLSVYIPAGEAAETVNIAVTTVGGASARTSADQYTYLAPPPAPTVTGVSPNAGTAAGGDTVTITGTGFSNASDVSFGGVSASFTVNNDGSITATTPATSADGTVDVTVTNLGGTSATDAADQFTYTDAPPTVTGVSPSAGTAAGGDTVTISGTSFTTATGVNFGGVAAASFTVNNDGSITAVTPAGNAGTVDVTVSAVGGTSATSTADHFTYT